MSALKSTMFLAVTFVLFWPMRGSADEVILLDSFEQGSQRPENWRSGAQVGGVKYVYDRIGSDGKKSLSLQKSANRYFPIAQWTRSVRLKGNSPAVGVVVKVKATQVTKAIVDLQFRNKAGGSISHEWVAYIGPQDNRVPITHDWKDYGGKTKVPAGTEQVVVALQIYGPGRVWFDELELFSSDDADGAAKRLTGTTEAVPETVPDMSSVRASTMPPRPTPLQLSDGSWTRYISLPPTAAKPEPVNGHPLLLVLPGGTGSPDFYPFVSRLHREALEGEYFVVQPIAPPPVVWPTEQSRSHYATTEQALAAIVQEVAKTHAIDRRRVFALAWSSSGPAIYSALLQEQSPLAGAFIAMSVFQPGDLPQLSNVSGKRVFIYHSPDDQVCPYGMARQATESLKKAGGITVLREYAGGHGWQGNVSADVRAGLDWLENK